MVGAGGASSHGVVVVAANAGPCDLPWRHFTHTHTRTLAYAGDFASAATVASSSSSGARNRPWGSPLIVIPRDEEGCFQ